MGRHKKFETLALAHALGQLCLLSDLLLCSGHKKASQRGCLECFSFRTPPEFLGSSRESSPLVVVGEGREEGLGSLWDATLSTGS